MLDTAGARDRSGFPRAHPKEHVRWPCTLALGHKRRERWHTFGYHRKHRRPFHSVKGVGTVSDSGPAARLMQRSCPHSHMLHASGYGDPKLCLTSPLTSSNRGRHSRMTPAGMSLLRVMPTQNGRHFRQTRRRSTVRRAAITLAGTHPARRRCSARRLSYPVRTPSPRCQCG